MERVIRHFNYFLVLRQKHCTETPFTRTKKIGSARQIFGTVPGLPGRQSRHPWCHITSGTEVHVEIGSAVPDFLARVNNEV